MTWCALTVFVSVSFATHAQESYQHFIHLKTQDGLANNVVYDIVPDQDGYLWIASEGGLQRYDGRGFVTYSPDKFHIPVSIRDLYCDGENNLWLMSADRIFRYERSSN